VKAIGHLQLAGSVYVCVSELEIIGDPDLPGERAARGQKALAHLRRAIVQCARLQCIATTKCLMSRSTTSIRLEDTLRKRLATLAAAEGTTLTELIERFVREGLESAAHPGIVFKPGPSGRRAALAGGPDVWEIVAALRDTHGSEAERVAALAAQFGIHERQVAIALDYAAAHRDDVEARIEANDRALAEAERVARERERLLA
jgi:sulfur carrier protein ThiS